MSTERPHPPSVEAGPFVGDDLPCRPGDRVGRDIPGEPRPHHGKQPFDARWAGALGQDRASVAGTHGSRTHRAAPSAAPLVLKTRGPTGTRPLPARW